VRSEISKWVLRKVCQYPLQTEQRVGIVVIFCTALKPALRPTRSSVQWDIRQSVNLIAHLNHCVEPRMMPKGTATQFVIAGNLLYNSLNIHIRCMYCTPYFSTCPPSTSTTLNLRAKRPPTTFLSYIHFNNISSVTCPLWNSAIRHQKAGNLTGLYVGASQNIARWKETTLHSSVSRKRW
jgi:hypothetical protein